MPSGPDSTIERCHRCFQPVPQAARRCPNCGDVQTRGTRKFTLYVGIFGLVMALALIAVSLMLHGNPPDSQSPDEGTPVEKPSPPPKPPVLDR